MVENLDKIIDQDVRLHLTEVSEFMRPGERWTNLEQVEITDMANGDQAVVALYESCYVTLLPVVHHRSYVIELFVANKMVRKIKQNYTDKEFCIQQLPVRIEKIVSLQECAPGYLVAEALDIKGGCHKIDVYV